MKLENYKSGIYRNQDNYRSFLPTIINQDYEYSDMMITKLLSEAEHHYPN